MQCACAFVPFYGQLRRPRHVSTPCLFEPCPPASKRVVRVRSGRSSLASSFLPFPTFARCSVHEAVPMRRRRPSLAFQDALSSARQLQATFAPARASLRLLLSRFVRGPTPRVRARTSSERPPPSSVPLLPPDEHGLARLPSRHVRFFARPPPRFVPRAFARAGSRSTVRLERAREPLLPPKVAWCGVERAEDAFEARRCVAKRAMWDGMARTPTCGTRGGNRPPFLQRNRSRDAKRTG